MSVLDANMREVCGGMKWWLLAKYRINITVKRHFLTMNKKDVLGLRPAADRKSVV